MVKAGEPMDLDVLDMLASEADEDGYGDASPRFIPPRPRRRWPGVGLAICVLTAVIAFPVRAKVNGGAFALLDQRWQTAMVLQERWRGLNVQIEHNALPTDNILVGDTVMSLDRELASRFDSLRSAVAHQELLDGALRRLAGDERAALALGSERLRRHTFNGLEAGVVENIERQLTHERVRWHRRAATAPHPVRRLHAADATVAALGKWFDQPTGAVLVQATPRGLQVVDIDRQSVGTRSDQPADQAIARKGYIAVHSNGTAVAVATDTRLSGWSQQTLGAAAVLVAAAEDDAVWLVTFDPVSGREGGRQIAVKTDWSGRQLARLAIEPAAQTNNVIIGECTAGLVVWNGRTTVTVHALDGAPVTKLDAGTPFSVADSKVALVTPDEKVEIWDPEARTVQPLSDPPGYRLTIREGGTVGELSPDGTHLALQYSAQDSQTAPQIGIVDVATGAVSVVPAFADWVQSFAWAPDGKTVFFTLSTPGPHSFGLYRLGAPNVEVTRATALDQFSSSPFTVLRLG